MFRQRLLFACIGLSLGFLLSCRASQNSLAPSQTYVGRIYVIGNDPFGGLALKLEDGRTYVLECDKEIEAALLKLQSRAVRVTGQAGAQKPEGQVLRVIRAEAMQEN